MEAILTPATYLTIATLFAVAVVATALTLGVLRLMDKILFPSVSFEDALKEGNLAVGIFLAGVALGVFQLVASAVG